MAKRNLQPDAEGAAKRHRTETRPYIIQGNNDHLHLLHNVTSPKLLFQNLLAPLDQEEFFGHYWEKQPVVIKRQCPEFYKDIFSRSSLLNLVKNKGFRDLRIKRFDETQGIKVDYDRPCTKAATLEKVWAQGWTVQAIQPQRSFPPLSDVIGAMEEVFQCTVGCNAYLTPAHSQGLAPHYDDIEAFILQVEGTKEWRLYHSDMELPREYSRDFKPEEIGDPFLTVILEPGDLMYFPRGTIHHVKALEVFSHHLTISTYQKHSFYDLLSIALPEALETALQHDVELRKGLPLDSFHHLGAAFKDHTDARQTALLQSLSHLVDRVKDRIDFHSALDCMATDFTAQRLPPPPTVCIASASKPKGDKVRLINPSWLRMVVTKDDESSAMQVVLFHCLGNSKERHMDGGAEADPGCINFPASHATSLALLIQKSPEFITLADLAQGLSADECNKLVETLVEAKLAELSD